MNCESPHIYYATQRELPAISLFISVQAV